MATNFKKGDRVAIRTGQYGTITRVNGYNMAYITLDCGQKTFVYRDVLAYYNPGKK